LTQTDFSELTGSVTVDTLNPDWLYDEHSLRQVPWFLPRKRVISGRKT